MSCMGRGGEGEGARVHVAFRLKFTPQKDSFHTMVGFCSKDCKAHRSETNRR